MPAPTLTAGAPCWIDLYSSDTGKATAFYGGILGWKAEPPREEFGGYFTFTKDGKHVAGCMASDAATGAPDAWTLYLTTGDLEATARAAAEHGAEVRIPPMKVAENGSFAMFADPAGAQIGAWQPDAMKGFEVRDEAGTPGWFELHTRDYDGAVSFYRDVFDWNTSTASDTPELRYTVLAAGEGQLAGIMDASAYMPEGAPAQWSVYFRVDDVDATLAKAVEMGGKVLEPAMDTPYGRLAKAADPTGAEFKLIANG